MWINTLCQRLLERLIYMFPAGVLGLIFFSKCVFLIEKIIGWRTRMKDRFWFFIFYIFVVNVWACDIIVWVIGVFQFRLCDDSGDIGCLGGWFLSAVFLSLVVSKWRCGVADGEEEAEHWISGNLMLFLKQRFESFWMFNNNRFNRNSGWILLSF